MIFEELFDSFHLVLISLIIGVMVGKSKQFGKEVSKNKYWFNFILFILILTLWVFYFQNKSNFFESLVTSFFLLYFTMKKPVHNFRNYVSEKLSFT